MSTTRQNVKGYCDTTPTARIIDLTPVPRLHVVEQSKAVNALIGKEAQLLKALNGDVQNSFGQNHCHLDFWLEILSFPC